MNELTDILLEVPIVHVYEVPNIYLGWGGMWHNLLLQKAYILFNDSG